MQRLIDAAKFTSSKLQRTGSTSLLIAKAQLDAAISDAERQAAGEKSELEQLRAENKKLRDAMQDLQILGRARRQAFCEVNEVIGLKGGE